MQTIEQYYNSARKHFIIHQGLFIIGPIYATINFFIQYLVSNKTYDSILEFASYIIISSLLFGIGFTLVIMFTFYRKQKIIIYSDLLKNEFPNLDNASLVLLSFYLIKNKKTYNIANPEYFNKTLARTSKTFGIEYNKIDDNELVTILSFGKQL